MERSTTSISGLTVQQLQTFVLVYEHLSYSAAARVRGLSVPAIWEQVRSIEAVYGTTLFKKAGRRIDATESARRLYDSLVPILNGLESTIAIAREQTALAGGSVTVIAGARMMLEDLAIPIARFRDRYSNIQLQIRLGNDVTAEEFVIKGNADLAFTLEPSVDRISDKLHYESVYAIDIVAAIPKAHELASKRRMSLRDLAQHELVVGGPRTHVRQSLEEAFHRAGLQTRIASETDNGAFTLALVQAGMGVGILAGNPDGILSTGIQLRSLRRQLGRRRIVAIWKRGRCLTKPIQELVESVRLFHS